MRQASIFLIIITFFFKTEPCSAQISTGESPPGLTIEKITSDTTYSFKLPPQNLKEKDETALLAGYSINIEQYFKKNATAHLLSDSSVLWQMNIHSPGASGMGFILSELSIPAGDKLFVYHRESQKSLGAFTRQNNQPHGLLSIQILPYDELTIEYHESNLNSQKENDFLIQQIIHITNLPEKSVDGNKQISASGECNININCPEGDLWQKQKRGVARIVLRSGDTWFYCTGSLMNNTNQDQTPYFLTANHCGTNASEEDYLVWQFYFDYEYLTCENSGLLSESKMIEGSTLISKGVLQQGTDFKLLLLEDEIPEIWMPYFNGWSLSTRSSDSGVSIHHPSGDAKKISIYDQPLQSGTFTLGLHQGFWKVNWTETQSGYGVTEGGSSGAPLFDQDGLIIGTLTGGGASCDEPQLTDYFGKFSHHWVANGTEPEMQIKPWLDPLETDTIQLYGFDPNVNTNFVVLEIVPALSGVISGSGYYAENEMVLLNAVPNPGFKFVSWTDQNGMILSTLPEYSFIMPSEQTLVKANFKEIENHQENISLEESVRIFPNPSTGNFFVEIKNTLKYDQNTLKIINTSGQVIFKQSIGQNKQAQTFQINLQDLGTGIYFLQITNPYQSYIQKILMH
ncbi:MAG: InlB B-repeat-containing protein [Bacteroidota bacterium]